MTKTYKNVEEFLIENFPKAYLKYKNEEEESLQHYIDTFSNQLSKAINEILQADHHESRNKESIQT